MIVDESNAKARMGDIDRFTPAFPNSRFDEPVASYAMMSLSELKDTARVIAYGEKALATNPNSLPTLLLLAGTYVEDPKPGSLAKAVGICAESSHRGQSRRSGRGPRAQAFRRGSPLHSGLCLHEAGQDRGRGHGTEVRLRRCSRDWTISSTAVALYRLGYAYAKLNRTTEARDVLDGGGKDSRPGASSSQDLLSKVNAASAKGK